MLRIATDADVQGPIIRGLRLRIPELDLIRVDDVLNQGTPDPDVLAWAAEEARVVITNDRSTMIGYAESRFAAGEPFFGLIVTSPWQSFGGAIKDLEVIIQCMSEEEVRDRGTIFLPF